MAVSDPKAFLDTTVLADRILGGRVRRALVEDKLKSYARRMTSRFVLLEFKLGAYHQLVRFQAAAEMVTSLADLHARACALAALPVGNIHRRAGQARQQALGLFLELWERRGLGGTAPLEALRAFLRALARAAWREAVRSVERIIDPSGCLGDLPEPRWNEDADTVDNSLPRGYIARKANALAGFIRRQRVSFQRIADALAATAPAQRDEETERRIQAIRRILTGQQDVTPSDIRRVGDAFVAVECPHDHDLLNNNTRHFDPICAALGKRSVRSFDPA